MYTLSKGSSKIAAKTRRGISQNLERLETLRDSRKPAELDEGEIVSVPKPVFHAVNGKKSNSMRAQQEIISPQHEEIIRFIYESWNNSVCKEHDQESSDSSQSQSGSLTVVYYEDSELNHILEDFQPFDLEAWWGKRLFNTITKSVP